MPAYSCLRCGRNAATIWWKCCPEHCSERGPDMVCESCAQILHPGEEEFLDCSVNLEAPFPHIYPCRITEWSRVTHCNSCEMVPELLSTIAGLRERLRFIEEELEREE